MNVHEFDEQAEAAVKGWDQPRHSLALLIHADAADGSPAAEAWYKIQAKISENRKRGQMRRHYEGRH